VAQPRTAIGENHANERCVDRNLALVDVADRERHGGGWGWS
jgi:hypothetical protein